MLMYCYDKDYMDAFSSDESPLGFHLSVYMVADKYLIDGLEMLACYNFEEELKITTDHDHIAVVLERILELTQQGNGKLQATIRAHCVHNLKGLLTNAKFLKVLESDGAFSTSLLREVAPGGMFMCGCCEYVYTEEYWMREKRVSLPRRGTKSSFDYLTCANLDCEADITASKRRELDVHR